MREATAIQVMQIIAGVGCLGLGVAGVMLAGKGRGDADEHDLADYQPALHPSRRDWPLLDRQPGGPRRLRPGALLALADPVGTGVTPPLARRLLIERAVPTRSDAAVRATADDWLREIAAEQHALAVTR